MNLINSVYLHAVCYSLWRVSGAFGSIRLGAFSAVTLLSLRDGHQRGAAGTFPLSTWPALPDTLKHLFHVIQSNQMDTFNIPVDSLYVF